MGRINQEKQLSFDGIKFIQNEGSQPPTECEDP